MAQNVVQINLRFNFIFKFFQLIFHVICFLFFFFFSNKPTIGLASKFSPTSTFSQYLNSTCSEALDCFSKLKIIFSNYIPGKLQVLLNIESDLNFAIAKCQNP